MKFFSTFVFLIFCSAAFSQQAEIETKNNNIRINYHGRTIFTATLTSQPKPYSIVQQAQKINGATYQVITITAGNFKSFDLKGVITGDEESIACESEPADEKAKVVRQVVGKSFSLLNNAVYDRREDWLLSCDRNSSKITVTPADNNKYELSATGWEIVIRFLPQYYQRHRGLNYFNPASYSVWKKPVAGWCSWFAYYDKITEADIRKTADVLSEKLKPFGLDYLQIDDGYQQTPIGMPDTWLKPNKKFSSGLNDLAKYIIEKGLTPGIWTNVSFVDSAAAFQNKNLFVQDKNKQPAFGNWIGYIMDGSNPATINKLISPVYSGLVKDGWHYFKLDALRHLKYEGYNSYKNFFDSKHYNRNDAFRNVVKEVRKQIGRNNFLLACWGIRPELVGIVDGCRIGNDGFSYAGLAQYNSYNNIVWKNDPDHIVLSEKEAYRSCTATSLTGSLFMLTDKPEKYESSPLIEAAKRSLPVLFTQPGQVYDVDPSRSSLIQMADVEMSGSGPRPFDAGTTTTTGLFSLEISKPFEDWLVLGRLDERDKIIPFKDLGLDEKKDYLVFEFWTKRFYGSFQKQFEPGNIDSIYKCQAFCFREKQDHPQLMATNRHISCGGLELSALEWKDNTLSGESELVPNDKYVIYIYEPDNFQFEKVLLADAKLLNNQKEGNIRMITLSSATGGNIKWKV
ncbi:MAG TPA: alpha-galactosidase, partial [Chitinophagaceae bacterium]|nr:alpha-galactosidase [Chitinophagaceae bacterium]